ncbi:MAG: ribonuclease H-like domain-containing protein [Methanobacteriaceae archaeon]|nr:ribonuclease H-like domain-containing protein [Methanobacteriaceae archaeon]
MSTPVENPHELKKNLLLKYQEHSLDDLPYGNEVENIHGTCFSFKNKEKIKIKVPSPEKIEKMILDDLKLLKGVGPAKENRLKEEGYQSLADLCEHATYGSEAVQICNLLGEKDFHKLSAHISETYFPSHPLNTICLSAREPENILFMDIETMGLDGVPLILIGVARLSGKKLETVQFLLRNLSEEKAVLESFASLTQEQTLLVTFNGRSFDAPFIKRRMRHHHLDYEIPMDHLDLLYPSRSNWKSELPNCQLQTLEKHLFNMERVDDVPSYLVPDFYKTYLQESNIGPLVPILEHNREDVITLVRLLSLIQESI